MGLTQDVNVSISDTKNHYNRKKITDILKSEYDNIDTKDLYVLDTVFTECPIRYLFDFCLENKIDYKTIKKLYANWSKNNKKKSKNYEWFFYGRV